MVAMRVVKLGFLLVRLRLLFFGAIKDILKVVDEGGGGFAILAVGQPSKVDSI